MDAIDRRPPEGGEPGPDEREDLLLGSPLGRQFLAECADPLLEHTLFTSLGLGAVPNTAEFSVDLAGGPVRRVRRRKRRAWHQVPAAEVCEAVRAAVGAGQWRRLGELSETGLLDELAGVTELFGFGGGDEALWGLTAVAAEELRPVAAALARSPGASRWWDPVRRPDQRQLTWAGQKGDLAAVPDALRRDMAAERAANRKGLRKRPRKGERNLGATWWSAPDFAEGTWTTGACDGLPTIELRGFIDTFTPFDASTATVRSLTVAEDARVAEIRRPRDWQDLVARFPRDATGTHDGEWRTWADADGPWYLPDWEAVAEHFDGVHVTIGGYLASCGLALPVQDGCTVLAGWVPDATVWVRDVATGSRLLGRWQGDPTDVGEWPEVLAGWRPEQ